MANTPNMGMTLPTPTVTPGPLYATENNQAFTVIDAHDHSAGNGVPIPSTGINLNGDLPFNGFNATLLRSTIYQDQSAPLALPTDISSIYSVGGNLYWNNGIGQPVQITAGAALNAASIGGIGGDYTTSGASVFYTSATFTYTFWSSSNTTGSIEAGPLTIRNNTLNSFGVTINANATISANYSLVLPAALPGSGTKFLTVDPSGNVGDVYDVDNSTIVVTSNTIKVPNAGITNAQLASNSVDTTQIVDHSVTQVKLGAINSQTSSSSLLAATESTTFVEVGFMGHVTITTTGRPVMLMLQADTSGNQASLFPLANSGGAIRFFRVTDSVPMGTYTLAIQDSATSSSRGAIPSSSVMYIDTPSAGTWEYSVQFLTNTSSVSTPIQLSYTVLVAYEL